VPTRIGPSTRDLHRSTPYDPKSAPDCLPTAEPGQRALRPPKAALLEAASLGGDQFARAAWKTPATDGLTA